MTSATLPVAAELPELVPLTDEEQLRRLGASGDSPESGLYDEYTGLDGDSDYDSAIEDLRDLGIVFDEE